MHSDWFGKVDPMSPKYCKQVHNIMNREFINKLKSEHKELKGIREADMVSMVRDFHKETVIPYVLNNRAPVELPFMIGDMFLGIIDKTFLSIYFTAHRVNLKGNISRGMWQFNPTSEFRKRVWGLRKTYKKWKKFVHLAYKTNAGKAAKDAFGNMTYTGTKKLVDLSDYNEFEMSI